MLIHLRCYEDLFNLWNANELEMLLNLGSFPVILHPYDLPLQNCWLHRISLQRTEYHITDCSGDSPLEDCYRKPNL